MISSLITWLLLVIIITFIHHYIIEVNESRPIYMQWRIIKGFLAITHGAFSDAVNIEWSIEVLVDYWPLLIFQLCSFYLIFDPLLAKLRKLPRPFLYRGKDSGWMDRLPMPAWITLKICCVGGLTYSLITLL